MANRFFRLVAGVFSVPLSVLFAQSPVTQVSELMQEFSTTLEELAKSTVLLSDYSYFVNDLFLSIWVSAELSRVTGHLSSLSHSIRECETVDGNTPELQVLRYEIERIIEELHGVDQRIPSEIFS